MKRKSDKTRWREKLNDDGLRCLEKCRLKQKTIADARKRPSANVVDGIVSKLEAVFSRQVEANKKNNRANLTEPEAIAAEFEFQLRELFLKDVPPVVDIACFISDMLEEVGPEGRKGLAFLLACVTGLFWSTLLHARKQHFGNAKLTHRQSLWILGTALANTGNVYRTGDPTPITKGRANPELIDLVREIRKHEQERLSYRELKDAIEYAGLHCPDEDSLRLFVHRARKRGWL